MMLLPIADILLIETRVCTCGSRFEVPSPCTYRLYKSPTNEPEKTEIRALKHLPATREEQADLTPHERRAIRYIEVKVPYCTACFTPTNTYAEVESLRPLPPTNAFHQTAMQMAFARAQSAKPVKPSRKPALSLDDLAASLGL
jgi:hypothetical protein